ncbi:MAG: hypothetical protein AAF685_16535 [Cyanobacteria bacterium P01_C01_bin.89]
MENYRWFFKGLKDKKVSFLFDFRIKFLGVNAWFCFGSGLSLSEDIKSRLLLFDGELAIADALPA